MTASNTQRLSSCAKEREDKRGTTEGPFASNPKDKVPKGGTYGRRKSDVPFGFR
jgi:hypothetical protein